MEKMCKNCRNFKYLLHPNPMSDALPEEEGICKLDSGECFDYNWCKDFHITENPIICLVKTKEMIYGNFNCITFD